MIRGIERRKIFFDDEDRNNLIERLSVLLPETRTQCYAWALMPNHAHFLMRSGPAGLSLVMRRLLTGYAVYFNRRHKRHGQLFQNRFKSIICQEDVYFQELVRYIHLNPLRARLINDLKLLDRYPYSGHSVLMGRGEKAWQDTEYVLRYFGKTSRGARNKYRAYVEKGIDLGRRPELVGGGMIRSMGGWDEIKKIRLKGQDRIKSDQRILGDSNFVLEVLAESREKFNRKYELKSRGFDFDKIVEKVSELFDIEKDYIAGKGRQKDRVIARDLVCYWCVAELEISITDLAKRFNMSPSAISYAVTRGEKMAKERDYVLE
jgi:REP element-mobilizing transposase RayT